MCCKVSFSRQNRPETHESLNRIERWPPFDTKSPRREAQAQTIIHSCVRRASGVFDELTSSTVKPDALERKSITFAVRSAPFRSFVSPTAYTKLFLQCHFIASRARAHSNKNHSKLSSRTTARLRERRRRRAFAIRSHYFQLSLREFLCALFSHPRLGRNRNSERI